MNLESRFYEVNGNKIHVVESFPNQSSSQTGNEKLNHLEYLQHHHYGRRPVILIHGLIVASEYLKPLALQLSNYFKVFIPDLPGYGKSNQVSSELKSLNVEQLADFVVQWMQIAGIENAIFFANSFGCHIVTSLASRYPSRVDKAILQGPTMGSNRMSFLNQIFRWQWNGLGEPISMAPIMFKDYYSAGWRQSLSTLEISQNQRIEDNVSMLTCPTLIVSCERDPSAPVEWCHELKHLNDSYIHHVMLEGASHTANYSHPFQLASCIIPFMLQQTSKSTTRNDLHSSPYQQNLLLQREIRRCKSHIHPWIIIILIMFQSILLLSFSWKQMRTFSLQGYYLIIFHTILSLMTVYLLINMFIFLHRIVTRKKRSLILDVLVYPNDEVIKDFEYIANFDSASFMLKAVSHYLCFRSMEFLGVDVPFSKILKPLAHILNYIPNPVKSYIYSMTGAFEATSPSGMDRLKSEDLMKSIVLHYPFILRPKFPAIAIGSSNGALTHLYTMMGIPWLPQTILIPVKRPKGSAFTQSGIFDMKKEMQWGEGVGRRVLQNNPDWQLHHMADPNQDHLMIRYMSYFRFKSIKLGESYKRFLLDTLEPGGTIIIPFCKKKWPCVRISDRHYFQIGAHGGIESPEGYSSKDPEYKDAIDQYIRKLATDSNNMREEKGTWNAPESDYDAPEAEWGFDDKLYDDICRFAQKNKFKIQMISYQEPEDCSPFIADFMRKYTKEVRHIEPSRLIVETFIFMEPFLVTRTGQIPYWAVFSVKSASRKLEQYLNATHQSHEGEFKSVKVILFSHGINSIGYSPPSEWKQIIKSRNKVIEPGNSKLLGVNEDLLPQDFASNFKYYDELLQYEQREQHNYIMPPAVDFSQVIQFWKQNPNLYSIEII